MTWSLVREAGVEFAADPAEHGLRLHHPVFAERGPDGASLIVDELRTEIQVPFRFECRTVQIDADHKVLFDTSTLGIHDGTGCLMDDDRIAILRRTTWELLIFSPNGGIEQKVSLARLSKRMPRFVRYTHRQTFLVVFFNRSFDVDVIEVDREGRLLWFLPDWVESIGIVGNVQLLPSDTLLVADPFRHVVVEVNRQGNIVWHFGLADQPARSSARLANPTAALHLADGRRLVADTRNHRIVDIPQDGNARSIDLGGECLTEPGYANRLDCGSYLVCDTGNRRVIEIEADGRIVWQCGRDLAARRHLSYPRSVEVTGPDSYLVADTAHDRIVEITGNQVKEHACQTQTALFWPRCVRALPGGNLLIADSRNARVVELSRDGQIINELQRIRMGGRCDLQDPHDVRMLANGLLLITDSSLGLVIETDWEGNLQRVIGDRDRARLRDPHSACKIENRGVLVADTGNHRIVIAADNGEFQEFDTIYHDSCCYRLRLPRYAEMLGSDMMVIVDTGNNRVLAATPDGKFLWEFADVPASPLKRLNQPRWVSVVNQNEVVICDHFHHRLLHVRREA
jgi:hypothetical protein